MLSLEHGQSFPGQVWLAVGVDSVGPGNGVGVSKIGVAGILNVTFGAGVTVTRNRSDPQDARENKTKMAGSKKKIKNFLFMGSLFGWMVLLGYHKQTFCWENERLKRLAFPKE